MDTGGSFPGGYFANAYDIIAEGLCIQPLKVINRGVEDANVWALIFNNVRWPVETRIDCNSMIATSKFAENRIVQLLERYGKDTVLGAIHQMMDRTERAVRSEIAAMPDGIYTGEASTDDDGTILDQLVTVRLDATIKREITDFPQRAQRSASSIAFTPPPMPGGGSTIISWTLPWRTRIKVVASDQADRAGSTVTNVHTPLPRCKPRQHGRQVIESVVEASKAAGPVDRQLGQAPRRLHLRHGSADRGALRAHHLRLRRQRRCCVGPRRHDRSDAVEHPRIGAPRQCGRGGNPFSLADAEAGSAGGLQRRRALAGRRRHRLAGGERRQRRPNGHRQLRR
jgi:hypothetical protein